MKRMIHWTLKGFMAYVSAIDHTRTVEKLCGEPSALPNYQCTFLIEMRRTPIRRMIHWTFQGFMAHESAIDH